MQRVVNNELMRRFDQKAIEQVGIPGIVLMENAGRNSAEIIIGYCREKGIKDTIILCGKGNNGGDGFVIARYLQKARIRTTVFLCASKDDISGDAATNMVIAENAGIKIKEISDTKQIDLPRHPFLVVDALLGTGIKGAVRGFLADIIDWINDQDAHVCAVDIPSGANGDTLEMPGPVVNAGFTVTMALPKLSQLFQPVRSRCGTLHVVDIGFPPDHCQDFTPQIRRVMNEDVVLPGLQDNLYKQQAGKVLLLGGSSGMTGALILAARAATVCGAGLVVAACAEELQPILENALTEQMTLGLPAGTQGALGKEAVKVVEERLQWADCIVLGPGLGRNEGSVAFVEGVIDQVLKHDKCCVIDADALFVLGENKSLLKKLDKRFILTPHAGEFARLMSGEGDDMEKRPWQALEDFGKGCQAVVNLKGAPSMVGHKEAGIFINSSGNPALAKGGSGDTLAGMIAAFCAAGIDNVEAACFANYLHGLAADNWVQKQAAHALTQDDLLKQIKRVLSRVEQRGSTK